MSDSTQNANFVDPERWREVIDQLDIPDVPPPAV